jgi:hypothetical protein
MEIEALRIERIGSTLALRRAAYGASEVRNKEVNRDCRSFS